jgi:hypothetical protein
VYKNKLLSAFLAKKFVKKGYAIDISVHQTDLIWQNFFMFPRFAGQLQQKEDDIQKLLAERQAASAAEELSRRRTQQDLEERTARLAEAEETVQKLETKHQEQRRRIGKKTKTKDLSLKGNVQRV